MTASHDFQIIGIDCAADPRDIGVAVTSKDGETLRVHRVYFGSAGSDRTRSIGDLAHAITSNIRAAVGVPTLMAVDAPLGWPIPMGPALVDHRAGGPLSDNPNADRFFRRLTDRFVAEKTGKTPIEIGANLIARVTHTTLLLIDNIAKGLPSAFNRSPLLSSSSIATSIGIIEVYPALATPLFLNKDMGPRAEPTNRRSWRSLGRELKALRREGWCSIRKHLDDTPIDLTQADIPPERTKPDAKGIDPVCDHGLDAILCAWTGLRFLLHKCAKPPDDFCNDDLEREGWIWFDSRVRLPIKTKTPRL